jgi:hypothetical protein
MIQNSFSVTVSEKVSHLSIRYQEPLVELVCDSSLKIKFEALPFSDSLFLLEKNVELSKLAITMLLIFGTTYLCEETF